MARTSESRASEPDVKLTGERTRILRVEDSVSTDFSINTRVLFQWVHLQHGIAYAHESTHLMNESTHRTESLCQRASPNPVNESSQSKES